MFRFFKRHSLGSAKLMIKRREASKIRSLEVVDDFDTVEIRLCVDRAARIFSSSPRTVILAMRSLAQIDAAFSVRGSSPSGRTMCCKSAAARALIFSRIIFMKLAQLDAKLALRLLDFLDSSYARID